MWLTVSAGLLMVYLWKEMQEDSRAHPWRAERNHRSLCVAFLSLWNVSVFTLAYVAGCPEYMVNSVGKLMVGFFLYDVVIRSMYDREGLAPRCFAYCLWAILVFIVVTDTSGNVRPWHRNYLLRLGLCLSLGELAIHVEALWTHQYGRVVNVCAMIVYVATRFFWLVALAIEAPNAMFFGIALAYMVTSVSGFLDLLRCFMLS